MAIPIYTYSCTVFTAEISCKLFLFTLKLYTRYPVNPQDSFLKLVGIMYEYFIVYTELYVGCRDYN